MAIADRHAHHTTMRPHDNKQVLQILPSYQKLRANMNTLRQVRSSPFGLSISVSCRGPRGFLPLLICHKGVPVYHCRRVRLSNSEQFPPVTLLSQVHMH